MTGAIDSIENLSPGDYVSVLQLKARPKTKSTPFGDVVVGGSEREQAVGLVIKVLAISPPFIAAEIYPEPGVGRAKPSVLTFDTRRVAFTRINAAYVKAMIGNMAEVEESQPEMIDAQHLHELLERLAGRHVDDRPV